MNCVRLREILPLYGGHDLDGATDADVAKHLATCRSCRQLADAFGAQSSLLRRYGRQTEYAANPPDLWNGLKTRLGGAVTDPLSPLYRAQPRL